jgi:hypothetical protein
VNMGESAKTFRYVEINFSFFSHIEDLFFLLLV